MSLTLLHNPRCSKSRAAHALLEEHGAPFETVLYLEHGPNADEIASIIALLGIDSARGMMRPGEDVYKELDLANVEDEAALIAAMCAHPKLIERPILITKDKAAIGRPTENLFPLLK